MDPVKAEFLIFTGIQVATLIAVFISGWKACRFAHRHDVKRAVDSAYRSIEDRRRRLTRESQL